MPNMRMSFYPDGLDREHNPPECEPYEVVAPYEMDEYTAVEWVLRERGENASSIECMGRWKDRGQTPALGYVFLIVPRG